MSAGTKVARKTVGSVPVRKNGRPTAGSAQPKVARTKVAPTTVHSAPAAKRTTTAARPSDARAAAAPARRGPARSAPARSPVARPRVAPASRAGVRTARRTVGRAPFAVLFCSAVGVMLLAVVSLNAVLAKASFRIDDLSNRIDALQAQHLDLDREQAELSAPGRIYEWARRNGMRLPADDDAIRLLHAPDASTTGPAGTGASQDDR